MCVFASVSKPKSRARLLLRRRRHRARRFLILLRSQICVCEMMLHAESEKSVNTEMKGIFV